MHSKGEGVVQSHGEAFKWYRLVADQGIAEAQCNLGVMYATGQGVEHDLDQVEHWIELVAHQRIEGAQQALLLVAADRAVSATSTPATTPSNSTTWPAGTKVVVHGLVKAAELNGRAGTIVRWMADKGRYQVDLDGRSTSIKSGNLKLGLRSKGQDGEGVLRSVEMGARKRYFVDGVILCIQSDSI